ncbi:hypothetical protein ES702_01430 [subsurface metagenome]
MKVRIAILKTLLKVMLVIIMYLAVYILILMMITIIEPHLMQTFEVWKHLVLYTPLNIKLTSIFIIIMFLVWYHKDKWWRW